MIEDFIRKISGKNIHLVGVSGSEGSGILRFLIKHNVKNITVHDFINKDSTEKNFKIWHKGLSIHNRDKLYSNFIKDLSQTHTCYKNDYLKDISKADLIFVPQSWRLYKKQNKKLWQAKEKNIPFYSLTKIYLELSPAKVIAVTGTVGKGSTAYLISQILKSYGKKVFFAGNETWITQVADKLDEMKKEDYLVLEVSHRQLLDGINKGPDIAIITNIYPNHLDEIDWATYQTMKYSLSRAQSAKQTTILNYDMPQLIKLGFSLKSKVIYCSIKNINMNTKNIQKIFNNILNIKSEHYSENILTALTFLDIEGVSLEKCLQKIKGIPSLPARLKFLTSKSNIDFYNDIKSTTPWSTRVAILKLQDNIILICGGRNKNLDYKEFAEFISYKVKKIYIIDSQIKHQLMQNLKSNKYMIVNTLDMAIKKAYDQANKGDQILISPAAAFFYTDFIKEKKSINKIITSLLPKEPKTKDLS